MTMVLCGTFIAPIQRTIKNSRVGKSLSARRVAQGPPVSNTDIPEQTSVQGLLTAAGKEMEHRVMNPTTPLNDANTRLRVLSRQLREGQEPERCAILRDMHDEMADEVKM